MLFGYLAGYDANADSGDGRASVNAEPTRAMKIMEYPGRGTCLVLMAYAIPGFGQMLFPSKLVEKRFQRGIQSIMVIELQLDRRAKQPVDT